jgi:hypothetical protein
VTTTDFRRIALTLPETTEESHMDHPDFRIRGKIFATLGHPAKGWGMVKLSPEQQHYFSKDYPSVFVPVKGAWGRRGATSRSSKDRRPEDSAQGSRCCMAQHRSQAPGGAIAGIMFRPEHSGNLASTLTA